MVHDREETVILSVGGSLIVPERIDTHFLQTLKTLIDEEIAAHERRFIIIAGGGKTARRYQDAASEVATLDPEDLDWMGIHATRLNGHLLRTIFRDTAYPTIITNPDEVIDIPRHTPLIIAAGYRPGASTDLRAIEIAERRSVTRVLNLSNIDHVYSEDPKKNPHAEKFDDMTWKKFLSLIPDSWNPGLSTPFDPIAARKASILNIEVAVINGTRIDEIKKYLHNLPFSGTRIHD